MTTSRIRVRLAGTAALLTAGLLFAIPASLRGQADQHTKLDRPLQERAAQWGGRSRVIVSFDGAPDVEVIAATRGRAGRRLPQHRAQVAEIDNAELSALADDPRVARVSMDREVFPTLARSGAATGALLARQQYGVTGRGVGVVVIDSGITSWHDDLYALDAVNRTTPPLVHFMDFTDYVSRADANRLPSDGYGHGTMVAGVIAGSGFDSDGARAGIAPGAHLISLKVLDDEGRGYISNVIAAIDYAIAIKDLFNVRVINLSVAAAVTESYHTDPLTLAVQRAVDAGIVVVAAAGNLGVTDRGRVQYGGITAPGNAPWVITVGAASHQGTAYRSDDVVAAFSSRGPSWIDFAAKPDLVAPGVGIEAPIDANSTLARELADYLVSGTHDVRYEPYLSLSGTSMAAPIVTGTVALMLEANPDLTPNAVKAILQYTAQVLEGESALAQGAGLLNTAGAIRMARFFAAPHEGLDQTADFIAGELVPWSRHIIWGNHRMTGGVPLPGANAWTVGLPWGAAMAGKHQRVEWGARTKDASADGVEGAGGRYNIVWATGGRKNIVWATGGRQNIVWATGGRQNIVWATGGRNNIVWATGGRQNIVWATGGVENVVWEEDCDLDDCRGTLWGAPRGDGTLWGTASPGDRIIWPTGGRFNIVWATGGRHNIVWATGGRNNIVWATGGRHNIVWATSGGRQIVWPLETSDSVTTVDSTAAPEHVVWNPGIR